MPQIINGQYYYKIKTSYCIFLNYAEIKRLILLSDRCEMVSKSCILWELDEILSEGADVHC